MALTSILRFASFPLVLLLLAGCSGAEDGGARASGGGVPAFGGGAPASSGGAPASGGGAPAFGGGACGALHASATDVITVTVSDGDYFPPVGGCADGGADRLVPSSLSYRFEASTGALHAESTSRHAGDHWCSGASLDRPTVSSDTILGAADRDALVGAIEAIRLSPPGPRLADAGWKGLRVAHADGASETYSASDRAESTDTCAIPNASFDALFSRLRGVLAPP